MAPRMARHLAENEPDPVKKKRILSNPALYYRPQSYEEINAEIAEMTDTQLQDKLSEAEKLKKEQAEE
jgi:hypothetical protein